MRVVRRPEDVVDAFRGARRTAISAFGDDRVYIEKYIENPRHIEIQVLADHHGEAIFLFERECSVQRRHQKIVEEAPASRLSPETRARMGRIATQAALAIGYTNAGTCEFIVDAEENAWFLEMNTRLQVEHPVTELVTGVDLVAEQLHIACGEPLRLRQDGLALRGHAIECRLYAEDPFEGYLPSPGRIEGLRFPEGPGVRVDAGFAAGTEVSEHYDPMIAKIVAWAPDRASAIERSLRALGELHVGGIRTNVALLQAVLECEPFRSGRYDTGLLEHLPLPSEIPEGEAHDVLLAVAALLGHERAQQRRPRGDASAAASPWKQASRLAILGGLRG
jgi:acetyl/propionyl-CoA carboxylase alpha subunit